MEEIIFEKINCGVEDVVVKVKLIFVDVICSMIFCDVLDIFIGDDDVVIVYFNCVIYIKLYDEFNFVIVNLLDKFNVC